MQDELPNPDLGFAFLPNPAEEDEGLGHAGIQTYRNDPYAGTARETGQNSRDVPESLPVKIRYDLLAVDRGDIPAIDELQSIVELCLAQSADKEKEKGFFSQALRVVKAESFKVLRIADSNTTGAAGPSVKGKPFHSLLKASGVSVKTMDFSGGSFGIGKNAVFAVSDLQTVFYSTLYQEQGKSNFLAQGKSILVSHVGKDGQPKRQTGYWGMPDFSPIDNINDAPKWLRRDDIGTSVFALGFRDTPDWVHRISYSLIQNFFYAIHAGEMEFALDQGRFTITKSNLKSWFEDDNILAFVSANDKQQEFELARSLYECITSSEAHEGILDLPTLGTVKIRVLVANALPKKVIIIRNGMVITDSLEHFGEKFSRFPMYRDFVAVVTPANNEGSAFIKRLEDPRHRELSPEGLPDSASRENAKKVMKRLAKNIREFIKGYTLTQYEGEISIDEMRRYFAAELDTSPAGANGTAENPERLRYQIERKKDARRSFGTGDGADDEGQGVGGETQGPGPAPNPEPSPPNSPNPNPHPQPDGPGGPGPLKRIHLRDLRNKRPVEKSAKHRTIFFTPEEGGLAEIVLQATGLQATEKLSVHEVADAAISNGRVVRPVVAGERVRLEVEFDDEYEGPLDVLLGIRADSGEKIHENQ